MTVTCKSLNYSVKEERDRYIISNTVYSASLGLLFITSLFEMMLPNSTTYKIPIILIIYKDDSEKNVIVDEKLHVSGTSNYEYCVSDIQISKWFKSYFVSAIITIFLMLFLAAFVVCFVLPNAHNILSLGALCAIAIIIIISSVNLVKQVNSIKRYKKTDEVYTL